MVLWAFVLVYLLAAVGASRWMLLFVLAGFWLYYVSDGKL